MEKFELVPIQELDTITGGKACSIFDIFCVTVEFMKSSPPNPRNCLYASGSTRCY